MDQIRINGFTTECVLGTYPEERTRIQKVRVDADVFLNTERAAASEALRDTVDYHLLSMQFGCLLMACEFRLLETAADVLAKWALLPPGPSEERAQIERLRLTLSKPNAGYLGGVPSVTIERTAGWSLPKREEKPWGFVDVVAETRDVGVYRLHVASGRQIPLHVHRVMHETEMALTEGLLCQGKPVAVGTIFRWKYDEAHVYDNPTNHLGSLLCIDRPPFIESDEIVFRPDQ